MGDALLVDRDRSGALGAGDEVLFITSRDSSSGNTVDGVQNVGGASPSDLDSSSTWQLFRAYASTADAEAGRENPGIPEDLRDFDTWADGRDMVAAREQWNLAVYGDGADTEFRLLGWVSSPVSYLRFFAPHLPAEVGVSQRHHGVWDDTKARYIGTNS